MTIDRAKFTPNGTNPDLPVPFGESRTVPTERMALLLAELLQTTGKVLEIGTGSGYQTAILAERCKEVVSVEQVPLVGLGEKLPANVTLIVKDGATYDSGEKFDGILVTFAAERITPAWYRQLKRGARLVIPLQLKKSPTCRICVYEMTSNGLSLCDIPAYAPFTKQVSL
jgi:protein-L-isoaspartate(D-aspartate) O-methyltransferase